MRVVIPGISGLLGRMVAEALVAKGHEVIGIDRRAWRTAPATWLANKPSKRASSSLNWCVVAPTSATLNTPINSPR